MKEKQRKLLAKILTVHGFRNSFIEDIHSRGDISQTEMKKLNKQICNQIYTLLYLIENGGLSWYFANEGWTSDWDEPKLIKSWIISKQE